jgi:FkbM family methyltransferase
VNVEQILEGIAKAERLANGAKWQRALHDPSRYLQAQWHHKVEYPRTHRGWQVSTATVFGEDMEVILPAGMDIYLLGAKGHSSELRLAKLLCKTLLPGQTFVDVGAHFGFFSGLAAKLVGGQGKVIACEAAPQTFSVLRQNLEAFSQATAHHLAIAAEPGKLTFTEFPVEYSEFNTLRPAQFDNAEWLEHNQPQQVEVEAMPLDDLLADEAEVNFIKIDVEGAEDIVIAGMKRLLERARPPVICMEYLTAARDNSAHLEAIAMLEQAGMHAHEISGDGELLPASLADIDDHLRRQKEDSDNVVFVR